MSFDEWNVRNDLQNSLRDAIEQGTYGRLSNLRIEVIDEAVVVEACSATYYAVQLALATINAFTVGAPRMTPAKLTFHVNGHELVLRNPNAKQAGRAAGDDEQRRSSDRSTPSKPRHATRLPSARQLHAHWQSS